MKTDELDMPVKAEFDEPSAIQLVARAEIDSQISTAKQYPRTISNVKKSMMEFATLDQETAESCFYSLPRGGKNIQGPSVRLAEIAVSCFQNIRVGARAIATVTVGDSPHVIIQAVCHDLQNNVAVTIEKRRRIVGKKKNNGKLDEDDINLATNACAAIAFRDAAFKVIPGALIKPVYEQAMKVAIGDAKTLGDRRMAAFDKFAKIGVNKDRILTRLGRVAIDDVTLSDLEILFGLFTAIKDGQATIEESFDVQPAAQASFGKKDKPAADDDQLEGAEIPAKTAASKDESKSYNHLKALRGLMQIAKVSEAELIDYMRGTGLCEDSLGSLDEVALMSPAAIVQAHDGWTAICKAISTAKEAKA